MLSDAFSPSIMSRSSSGDYFSCYASWGFLGGFRPCSLDRTPDNSRVDWPATLPSFFSSMGNVPCLAVLWIRHLGHARLLQDTLHCISHSVLGLLYLVYLYGFWFVRRRGNPLAVLFRGKICSLQFFFMSNCVILTWEGKEKKDCNGPMALHALVDWYWGFLPSVDPIAISNLRPDAYMFFHFLLWHLWKVASLGSYHVLNDN